MNKKVYKDMQRAFMNNQDPRRRQEYVDGELISDDHKAGANLSEKTIYRQWNPDEFVEKFKDRG